MLISFACQKIEGRIYHDVMCTFLTLFVGLVSLLPSTSKIRRPSKSDGWKYVLYSSKQKTKSSSILSSWTSSFMS